MSNVVLVKDTNNKFVPLKVDSNGALQCNVSDVELHAGDISVAVDGLEALQGTANTSLSGIKAELMWANNHLTANTTANSLNTANDHHITAHNHQATHTTHLATIATETASHDAEIQYQNNTGASGSLAHSLVAIKTAVEILDNTVSGNEIQCDIVSGTISLPSGASTEAKQVEMESSLDSLITANHSDLIALEATSELILAKNTEIESTADSILAKNTEVESSLNSLITANHSDLIALEATSELILAKNTEIESTADSILAKNTEIESTADSILAKNTEIESTADAILAKNTEIETELGLIKQAVQLLDNALDGNYLNVNANIAGTDVSSNSGNKDTATQRIVISTDDIPIALVNTNLGTVNSSVGTVNSSIGTANTHLNNIATAVQLLDNAVDGAYLNVNANIAGTDVSSNSGNKDSQTQRVCVATDDVPFTTLNGHLSEIEGAVESLEGCIDTNRVKVLFEAGDLNIGNVDVVSSALPSGASTETTLSGMSGKLPATLGQKANANCISTCRSSTAGAYDISGRTTIATAGTTTKLLCDAQGHLQVDVLSGGGSTDVSAVATHAKQDIIIGHVDGIEGLLTTIDSDTSAIKTAVQLLDNALDGNYFNVNANIAGTDVSSNSGNKDAQTQRVVIATDDIPIALVNTNLGAIKTAVQLLDNAVDGAYLNVNANIAGTDVSSNSGNKDAQTQRVVIATDDIPIALVNTNLVAIETTADAILAKNTQNETLLTSIAPRHAVATLSNATNLADGGATSIVDTNGYRYMTVFGKATNDFGLTVQYSTTNSASTMISLYLQDFGTNSVNSINVIHTVLEHPARYVRFINYNGSQADALTLYYQLSN